MSNKPLMFGINRAKRLAKSVDQRDRKLVLRRLGNGQPKRTDKHQELIQSRHAAAAKRGR